MLRRLWRRVGRSAALTSEPELTWADHVLERVPSLIVEVAAHTRARDPFVAIGMCMLQVEQSEGSWPSLVPDDAGQEDIEAFARAWCALALDNDALPIRHQLTRAELEAARKLLAAFFFDNARIGERTPAVFELMNERFGAARFAQASLLLDLFDTDAATQRGNERNFLSERNSHVMRDRRPSVSMTVRQEYDAVRGELSGTGLMAAMRMIEWLGTRAGLRFHVRCPAPSDPWEPVQGELDPDLAEALHSVTPHWRWRSAHAPDPRSLLERVQLHLTGHSAEHHLRHLTRWAYFITLATGRTGFEPFVVDYVTWLSRAPGTIGTRVLPDVHRRWVMHEQPLDEAIADVLEEHAMSARWGTGSFSVEAIEEALRVVGHRLADLDLREVPEGDYDLGGLVIDTLIHFPDGGMHRALRIHRLT